MKYYLPIVTWSVLIVFVLYQVFSPPSLVSAKGNAENGSIATIDIDGKKESEIESLLALEVAKWKEHDIIVQGTTGKIIIPSNYVQFDIKKTVEHYVSASSKPWYNFFGSANKIQVPLEITFDEEINELLKDNPLFFVDETIEAIRDHAGYLKQGPVQAKEVALSKKLLDRIAFEIQDVEVNVSGLSQISNALNETTLLNGEQFSFLQKLKEADSVYNDDTANFIASTLYSTVLNSEIEILERHSQNRIPDYLVPGVEVKVDAKRNQDFAFVNNTNRPVIIYASIKNGRLLIELYSLKSDNVVTYDVSNIENVKPRTIYRLTSTLSAGQEKVLEEGKDGLRVQVNKNISGGSFDKDVVISRDFYPPKNKVILVSSIPVLVSPNVQNPSDGSGSATNQVDTNNSKPSNPNTEEVDGDTVGNDGAVLIPEDVTYDKGGNVITPDPH